ncbi:uncharacterized protein SEPMUDRAFT_121777 [Sphaerulina musiva SO2202]|uniref:Uncharacterized protein n=1 Tax=Sphaerulina musiva (strain SO2202) TaxID=692275 RepID=M3CUN7_SPHMS|nr:uncharacterized protein SEPMUDRAFT_121777 [Sphaerulina musiva SO2202]EMF07877.1 hypothetical protein SEPMUDRAFT_121777 [Sphaerulina musiva SO2202]
MASAMSIAQKRKQSIARKTPRTGAKGLPSRTGSKKLPGTRIKKGYRYAPGNNEQDDDEQDEDKQEQDKQDQDVRDQDVQGRDFQASYNQEELDDDSSDNEQTLKQRLEAYANELVAAAHALTIAKERSEDGLRLAQETLEGDAKKIARQFHRWQRLNFEDQLCAYQKIQDAEVEALKQQAKEQAALDAQLLTKN